MVINELLAEGITYLKDLEYANPLFEARLILAKVLNVDKSYIYTYGDKEVSEDQSQEFLKLIKKRSTAYPIAYLLNEKQFMGLDLYIEEGVLIPRPDTEILVEYVLDYIKKHYNDKKINVLDIGIGSGAISLSVANYCPNVRVYGMDIGYKPIRVSNINKERLNLTNVSFHQGDLFHAIENLNLKNKCEIIISNPPYIRKEDIKSLQKDVQEFEPLLALDGGVDGLDFYRRITKEAKDYLAPGGLLVYEIGFDQGIELKNIMLQEAYSDIEIIKDLSGLDRVVAGWLK